MQKAHPCEAIFLVNQGIDGALRGLARLKKASGIAEEIYQDTFATLEQARAQVNVQFLAEMEQAKRRDAVRYARREGNERDSSEDRAMRKKKPKVVIVDGIPTKAISAAEHRRLELRLKKKHEKLRRRYPEVHGKKVDWISHWCEEGLCFFSVRFTDGREFSVACHPVMVTDTIDFSDMKSGDEVILREYYRRSEN